MNDPTPTEPDLLPPEPAPGVPHELDYAPAEVPRVLRYAAVLRTFFAEYTWFILRNLVGWILVLAAGPVGIALPGPGGLPLFLIGFALVSFPGKRRLTARVLRGRRLRLEARAYALVSGFVSILVPAILFWVALRYFDAAKKSAALEHKLVDFYAPKPVAWVAVLVLVAALTWVVTRLSLAAMDLLLRSVPKIRRKLRPWLRRKGFNLLPPRHKRDPGSPDVVVHADENEILEIDPKYTGPFKRGWTRAKPWAKRLAGVAVTVAIFAYMLRPIVRGWGDAELQRRLAQVSWVNFGGASVMFAAFLFGVRAVSWRRILKGFGHTLPVAAATRIWSTSELARYLPGAVWQVIGRVYLVKPYGVSGSVCSTTQVLELVTFLLANVLVAVPCLLYSGLRTMGPDARPWLFAAMAVVPLLAVGLHPRVFYGIGNVVLIKLRKPPITRRLRGKKLVGLLLIAMLGLLWQSLAVWLIVHNPLGLPLEKWWLVAGAYCLAWCAGFVAFWAPGGLGVRELVFVAAMQFAIPPSVRDDFASDPLALKTLLTFLSLLLRLWTIVGEMILTTVAYASDYRGAIGDPDAPGRVPERAANGDGHAGVGRVVGNATGGAAAGGIAPGNASGVVAAGAAGIGVRSTAVK